MSGLFNEASLVLVPSGYKSGKVYSEVPTNGDGDLSFTRSNDTATRVNSSGLIEKVRTNLLTYSEEFDDADWAKDGGGTGSAPVVTANAIISPDGTSNAEQIVFDAGAGTSSANLSIMSQPLTLTIGLKYAGSIYLKGQLGGEQIMFRHAAGATYTLLTLTTEWVRYDIIEVAGGTSGNFQIGIRQGLVGTINSTATIFAWGAQIETGDIATDYIPTTTTAVSVGMTANVPRLDYSGGGCPKLLLEPQTTALNQFSESFDNAYWTLKTDVTIEANTTDTLDPAGYYGAEKITETATTARHRVAAGITTLSAVNQTASVFMKKGTARYGFVTFASSTIYTIIVDLEDGTITETSTSGTIVAQKVEDYGNGWYRISVTGLSGVSGSALYALQFGSAGSAVPSSYIGNIPSFAGSTSNYLYAWGANLTATSYRTSYINTLSAASTRGADVCSKTGISSLINSPEGVLFMNMAALAEDNLLTGSEISISDGTVNNTVRLVYSPSTSFNSFFVRIDVGGVRVATFNYTGVTITNFNKFAVKWKENDFALWINGTEVLTDLSGATFAASTLNALKFSGATGVYNLQANISQAILFPTALTNTQLQELTTI